ncbi:MULTISPECIES: asparagine synthase-related protein [Halomonadaceae]|uniref:asparagine synthase-related protein n=1 Tax=Halomonadaceae TaxID=28256 RepID=UPI001581DB41|nr:MULTISPECIES: asparagine synthase-related protein [Halomonas]MDI4635982.1 asparagine synthase-related protein [Halomonas sp. BMC7]NUJ60347.1 hypothetical protein [Halomonas taeanensis]
MCGIFFCKVLDEAGCGHVDLDGLFASALEKMRYRGEDNVAVKQINGLYFGHSRLAINGLNSASDQPVVTDDYALIFNGEYYNYKENYPSKESDTLALFDHLQEKNYTHSSVNGPYAYAWYDIKNDMVFFRRDFFGEKPLYYYVDRKIFLVSSTLKSIVHFVKGVGGSIGLNVDALRSDYFFNGFVREPETIWEGVLEIPPNHTLVLAGESVSLKKEVVSNSRSRDTKKAEEYFKSSLLSRDVDAALLLSSGVDSNYLLVKSIEAGSGLSLVTYGGNDGEGEVEKVKKNLSKLKLDEHLYKHSSLIAKDSCKRIIGEELRCYAAIIEQPTSDGLQVNRILQHMKKEFPSLKVVYSGLGGDEMFGGYPTFKNFFIINILVDFPGVNFVVPKMRRFVEGREILGEWGVLTYYFLYRADPNYISIGNHISLKRAYERFKSGVDDSVPSGFFECYENDKSMQIKFLETFDYCKNQLLRDIDNIAMNYGVEARVPLLNPYLLNVSVDGKKKLKEYVKDKIKVNFGKKEGFSVLDGDSAEVYKRSLLDNQEMLEKIFGEREFGRIFSLDVGSMRKFSIAAEWLNINVEFCDADRRTLVAK